MPNACSPPALYLGRSVEFPDTVFSRSISMDYCSLGGVYTGTGTLQKILKYFYRVHFLRDENTATVPRADLICLRPNKTRNPPSFLAPLECVVVLVDLCSPRPVEHSYSVPLCDSKILARPSRVAAPCDIGHGRNGSRYCRRTCFAAQSGNGTSTSR